MSRPGQKPLEGLIAVHPDPTVNATKHGNTEMVLRKIED